MKSELTNKLMPTMRRYFFPFYQALCTILAHIVLIIVGFFLAVIVMDNNCEARTVFYGTETETVTVAYGGPTIFRFNEEVKTISQASKFSISPADQQSPSYTTLSVTPRFTRGASKVSFILSNGAVVSTKIVIVSKAIPEKTDSFYDFQPKEALIEKESSGKGQNVTELDLMKAMIRWEKVVGYKTRALIRTVKTGVSGLSAKLVRVYTGSKYNGYVFKIKNESNKKSYTFAINNLSLGLPNQALLSQVDRKFLGTKKSKKNVTFLRIVAKPTSVYYNINLPVAPIKAK